MPAVSEAAPRKAVAAKPASVRGHTAKADAKKGPAKSGKKTQAAKSHRANVAAEPRPEFELLSPGESRFGGASFYGFGFQGRKVATGERFDVRGMTAACNYVPLGTWVAVRREDTGRCIVVKVNDRMHVKHRVRIIDLSRGAAEQLRMISAGVAMVRIAPLPERPASVDDACTSAFSSLPVPPCDACVEPVRTPVLPNVSETVLPALE